MLSIVFWLVLVLPLADNASTPLTVEVEKLTAKFTNMYDELAEQYELECSDNPDDCDKSFIVRKLYKFSVTIVLPISNNIMSYLKETFKQFTDYLFVMDLIHLYRTVEYEFQKFTSDLKAHNQLLNLSVYNINDLKVATLSKLTVVQRNVDMIYKNVLTEATIEMMSTNRDWCSKDPKSIPFLHIYTLIATAYFKQYVMEKFYESLDGRFMEDKRAMLKPRTTIMKILKKTPTSDYKVRRCDPDTFRENQNYLQITKLLQGFILNQDGFTSLYNYKNGCNSLNKISCMRISKGRVCVSTFKYRRLDFIQMENGTLAGKLQYCSLKNLKVVNSGQQEPYLCLCDEMGITSDRVVTGLKFVKQYQIIHLQIQEGLLLANGFIDQASVRWVPINEFKITDREVYNMEDFFLLTHRSRTIAIDEIETNDEDYVVTGVGFYLNDDRHVQLRIILHEFDRANGKLNLIRNQTIQNNASKTMRKNITLSTPDIPTYTNKPSRLLSTGPAFISFTNTDYAKDAAQTTVPFLDSQEVTTIPAVAIRGAGIYYKGQDGYGGFLAPMVKTIGPPRNK